MRFIFIIIISLLFGDFIAQDANAIFGRRKKCRSYTTRYINSSSPLVNVGTAQEVAQVKAEIQARRGACFHPGGSMGGCSYEGVGMSSYSAQAALDNCCFSGQRQVVAQAVVQGANGWWYACRLFR